MQETNDTAGLNLPPYNAKMRKTDEGRIQIYDSLRRRYVALTPEEWVRQHFVHFLIDVKKYPQSLIENEKELRLGEKRLRCDSVVLGRTGKPYIIIEYKAPSVQLTQKVFDQIAVYNMLLHVDYLIVSNGMQHICCKMDYANNSYEYLPDIPEYTKPN
ncbi:MAG: type I restriction enzyme HsdR N-terminal domain-containing protein [Bacteroidaceae bacterium]|nr:type I restriction enzyme HsdR N-terminal domain-containing protein [Bacteroidaceae bacterium]